MAVSSCHFLPVLLSKHRGPAFARLETCFPGKGTVSLNHQRGETRVGLASPAPEIKVSFPKPCPSLYTNVIVGPGVPISKAEIFLRALAGSSHQLAKRMKPERMHKQKRDDLTFNGTALGPCKAVRQ